MNNVFAYPTASAADMSSMAAPGGHGVHVPTLPIAPEGGMPVYPGPSDNVGFPVPPIEEGGTPVYPGENTPVPPIAPTGGLPVYPGDNYPVPPIAPPGGLPVYPTPGVPSLPNRPGFPGIILPVPPISGVSQVRFLHAAINTVPVMISIGSQTVTSDLSYAGSTGYTRVPDGFRTVTVMSARAPRTILYRQNLPFRAGEKMTIAIINSANGIELMTVPDNTCAGRPQNFACFRMVNLSYNSLPVDLILFDGRVVFADVRFKEITSYRRARSGEYGFYVAVTPASTSTQMNMNVDIETVEEMPIAINDNYVPGYGTLQPLMSFYEYLRAGVASTAYFIGVGGNPTYPYTMVTLTTE